MDVLKRLQAMLPAHITPLSLDEMAVVHRRESEQYARQIYDHYMLCKVTAAVGRSGIGKKHLKCSFENYTTDDSQNQVTALNNAKQWLTNYLARIEGGFIFAGTTGTGKNHLACAIANELMKIGKSVLVITVSELMLKIRATYSPSSKVSESQVMKHLAKLDLLVIDEIGIQRGSTNEEIVLNEIINARNVKEKPTGILTNLSSDRLVESLGDRAISRVMEGKNAMWITFNWSSYRKKR